jgi:hypothetical protein
MSSGNVIADGDVEAGENLRVGKSIVLGIAGIIQDLVERRIFSTYGAVDGMVNGVGTILTNKDRLQTKTCRFVVA